MLGAVNAAAVEPDEILKDPKLEQRARRLSGELRCLVCQNQSIDDSNAPLARDLRLLVRERLKAGDNDKAILDYVVVRYGEFVLLRPAFGMHTLLLWLAPLLLLGGGLAVARYAMAGAAARGDSNQVPSPNAGLTKDELERLDRILNDGDAD